AGRPELIDDTDLSIIGLYGSEYRGYTQYYAYAANRYWLHGLHWGMATSLLKTLAGKYKSTVKAKAKRYAAQVLTRYGRVKCLRAVTEREGKTPLVATFGGIPLKTQPFAVIDDFAPGQDRIPTRAELEQRLRADECELCGSRGNIEVHHIRKLADLEVKGQRQRPRWVRIMASRRRKTLIVCMECHDAIHAGRPTRTRDPQDAPF